MENKIGIDLGGSHIAIGVIDKNGKILEKTDERGESLESLRAEKQKLEAKEKKAEELLEEVERAIGEKGEER